MGENTKDEDSEEAEHAVEVTYMGASPVQITAKNGAKVTVNITVQVVDELAKRGLLAALFALM